MKLFLLLLTGTFLATATLAQDEEEVKKKAEEAILEWAKNKFEYFDAPRFENFYLSPSDEFYALSILRDEYVDYKEEIVYNFKEGKSDRTEEEVTEDTTEIQEKIEQLNQQLAQIDPKFDHIEYFMWANIQTDNGLTVYYQHQFKLDENYNILSARVSSSVGKPEDVEILYKNN